MLYLYLLPLALVGKEHPASKSLHQLPLVVCTFPPLLFLHPRHFSSLSRTWWDGVEEYVCSEGESSGKLANRVSPGSTAVKSACVYFAYRK